MLREFVTKDIWLASAICLQINLKPQLKTQNSTVLFSFPASQELQEAVSNFYSDDILSLSGFSEIVKKLRHEMYEKREEGKRQ